jgi:hypothetical protein
MLGINPANNFQARLFGPSHKTDKPMPSLDEGNVIELATPYQARWGNKITNAGKRMFNQDSLLKEHLPGDHPNFLNQSGSEERMADIVQSAFVADPPAINGDALDVINKINALDALEQKNYYDNLGKDHLFESMSEHKMKMSLESYEAKHAHLINQGFTNQEAQVAIAHLRQEHAKKIAAEHVPVRTAGSMDTALESAFLKRRE